MRVAIIGSAFEKDISKIHRLINHYLQKIKVSRIVLLRTDRGVERIAMLYALKNHIPYEHFRLPEDWFDIYEIASIVLAFPDGEDIETRAWIKCFETAGIEVIKHELRKQWEVCREGMNIYMMYHYNKCRTGFRIKGKNWENGYAVVTRVGCAKTGKRINWKDPNLPDRSVMVDYYNLDDEKTGTGILRDPESMDYYLLEARTV